MIDPIHRPILTVIDGRQSLVQRRDEAHVEAISFCEEVVRAASRIVEAVTSLPIPSALVINEANRLAYKADFAKAELLALTTPEDAA